MRKDARIVSPPNRSARPLLRGELAPTETVWPSKPRTVLVTGTAPDRLNTNVTIRDYAAEGLRTLRPGSVVGVVPVDVAASSTRRHRPDLILAIGSVAVDGNELRELRQAADRAGSILALWLHDDPYEVDYAFRAEAVADIIFTNDAWARLHYRHRSVHHLPLAGCSQTYLRPVTGGRGDAELFFCGHAHANRTAFFRSAQGILRSYSVVVTGTGWSADLPFAVNGRLTPQQIADSANRAQFTLNLPRTGNVANRRFDLPAATPGPRTFEIALAGSAQICWSFGPEIADFFEPDKEIIVVEGLRDLARVLERARDEPAYVAGIAAAAQRRALLEHCYVHRMAGLLKVAFGEAAVPTAELARLPVQGFAPELARAVGQ